MHASKRKLFLAVGLGSMFLGAAAQAQESYQAALAELEQNWATLEDMALPQGCKLVGVELLDTATDLPSFRHPLKAAYVLGPEQGSLSDKLLERCDYVVRIPTSFCVNVAMAGAIVMYDRTRSLARFADRPIREGGPESPARGRGRTGGKIGSDG